MSQCESVSLQPVGPPLLSPTISPLDSASVYPREPSGLVQSCSLYYHLTPEWAPWKLSIEFSWLRFSLLAQLLASVSNNYPDLKVSLPAESHVLCGPPPIFHSLPSCTPLPEPLISLSSPGFSPHQHVLPDPLSFLRPTYHFSAPTSVGSQSTQHGRGISLHTLLSMPSSTWPETHIAALKT